MKKKLLMLMLMGVLALSACGDKAEETATDKVEDTAEDSESVDTEDVPVTEDTVEDAGIDAFLTMGEYKGLEVTKTLYNVTDEDVDARIESELSANPIVLTDANVAVEMGDIVNLDYSGSMDGVVFDGGTAEGYDLTIGSGSFIDDFEEQLVGLKVGDEKNVEVTFPDPYNNNPDFSGKDAVFAVKINQIKRPLDTVTQEWLDMYAEGATLDEYRVTLKETIEAENTASAETQLENDTWYAACQTVDFLQFPKDRLDTCKEQLQLQYESYAYMYGMEYDAFIEAMGLTEETLEEEAKNLLRNWLVLEYVCIKEGLTLDSEEYQQYETDILEENGYASKEDAVALGISEWNIQYTTQYRMVIDVLLDNANITETVSNE